MYRLKTDQAENTMPIRTVIGMDAEHEKAASWAGCSLLATLFLPSERSEMMRRRVHTARTGEER